MEQFSNDGRPRRREYSKAFKTQVVAQCGQPGASVGGIALSYGLHSNMVHRWIREARQDQAFTHSASQGQPAAFVALPLPSSVSAEGDQAGAAPLLLQLRLQRADWVVNLQCPAPACAVLLRELLPASVTTPSCGCQPMQRCAWRLFMPVYVSCLKH